LNLELESSFLCLPNIFETQIADDTYPVASALNPNPKLGGKKDLKERGMHCRIIFAFNLHIAIFQVVLQHADTTTKVHLPRPFQKASKPGGLPAHLS